MAQFYTNFGDTPYNQPPPGWQLDGEAIFRRSSRADRFVSLYPSGVAYWEEAGTATERDVVVRFLYSNGSTKFCVYPRYAPGRSIVGWGARYSSDTLELIRKVVPTGTPEVLASASVATGTSGYLRVQVAAGMLRAKVWRGNRNNEPATWNVETPIDLTGVGPDYVALQMETPAGNWVQFPEVAVGTAGDEPPLTYPPTRLAVDLDALEEGAQELPGWDVVNTDPGDPLQVRVQTINGKKRLVVWGSGLLLAPFRASWDAQIYFRANSSAIDGLRPVLRVDLVDTSLRYEFGFGPGGIVAQRRTSPTTLTQIGSTTQVPPENTTVSFRAQTVGDYVRLWFWEDDDEEYPPREPTSWQLSVSNTAHLGGRVGLMFSSVRENNPVVLDALAVALHGGTARKNPPRQYFTDFSEVPVGEGLTAHGWTLRNGDDAIKQEDGTVLLKNGILTWDAVERSGYKDVLLKVTVPEEGSLSGLCLWPNVNWWSGDTYWTVVGQWDLSKRQFGFWLRNSWAYGGGSSHGSSVNLPEFRGGTWWLRVVADWQERLWAKWWPDGTPEPEAWMITRTASAGTLPGFTAISMQSGATAPGVYLHQIGVGVNDAPAPAAPPGSAPAQQAEATDAAAAGWGGIQPEAAASVLVPDAEPQRFYTDFSTDQLGAPPAGWVWGVGAPAEVVVEAVGGRTAMKVDTWEPDVDMVHNKVLVWNAVPDASDVEVVARIFAPVRDGSDGPFVALRINPEESTGYIARIEDDDLWIEALDGAQRPTYRFGSYNIGVYPDDKWIWIRFRAEGSTLKAKAWPDGKSEPAGWQLEFTDTAYTTGAVGVGAHAYDGEGITQVYFYVSNFGVGTEGAQAPAAQPLYYVNFSGHPTGQPPGGAVVTWDPHGTAQFQVVATDSISGRAVKRVDAGIPAALYFAAYGDYVTDADVVARVRLNQEPNIQGGEMPVGIVLRGRPGDAGHGYVLSWYGSLLVLLVLVNGFPTGGSTATTAGTTEDWYWLRFRADGNLLRAKVWPADGKTPEPAEWAIEFEDQTHAAGFIGFCNESSNTAEVDAVAIGTYGQRAPAVVPVWRLDMDTLQARGDGPAATNHGTVLEWDPAIGPVRVFDGQSWVELEPADSMTAGAEDVAVVMWWRLSNVEGDPLVLYAEAADDVVQFGLTTEEFRTESTAGSHVMPVPVLTTDQWLCVAATYSTSRGDKAVYVNGQRVAQALGMTAPLTADRDVIRLGYGVDMSTMQAAQGRLAIVERYDQPLGQSDVLALYMAERARFLGQTQPAQTATAAPVAAPWAQHDAEATPGGRTATAEVTGWTPQAAEAEAETGPPPQRATAEVVEAGWGVAQPLAQGVPDGRTATAAGAAGVAWGETGARDATAASAITVEVIDPAETEPEAYTATAVPGPVWAEAEDVAEAPWSVPDGWAGTGSTPQQAEADALVAPWQGIDAEATPGRAATEAEAVAPWWAIPAPEVLASVSATATDSSSADYQVHDARALPGAAAAGTDPAAVEPKAWSADASVQVTASGPAPTWAAEAHDTEAEPGPVTADAAPASGQPQARDAEAIGGDPTDQQATADTPPSWHVYVPVAAAVALAVLATATAPAVATAAAHDGEGAPGARKAEAQAAQGFGAAVDALSLPGARKAEAVPATAWTPTAWDAPASSRTIAPALAAPGEPVVYLATGVAGPVTVEAEAGVVPWLAWDGEWIDVTYLPPVILEAPLRVIDVAVLARPLPVTGFAAVPVPLPLYTLSTLAQGGGGAPKVLQSVRLPAGGNGLTLRVPLEIPDSIVVTSSIEAELEAGHEGKVGYIPSVAGVEGNRETGYFVDFVVGKSDLLADATTHRCRVFLRFPGDKVLVTDPFLVEVIA